MARPARDSVSASQQPPISYRLTVVLEHSTVSEICYRERLLFQNIA
jgi:hypothetical protein